MAFSWTKIESVRKFLGGLKDRTSLGIAKAKGADSKDLDISILRATSHEECYPEEKYVMDIIATTKYSRAYAQHTCYAIQKRLAKTHNWVVAVKGLMLVDRLLRDGGATYKEELNGWMINMANFRDDSNMAVAWDYSSFVRLYSRYLEETLKVHHSSLKAEDTSVEGFPWLEKLPPLQNVMERLIATQPAGGAAMNRLTLAAFENIVVESFAVYRKICDGITAILPQFQDMDRPEAVKALDICKRAQKQFVHLKDFYDTCSKKGIVPRRLEFPPVVEVAEEHLQALEAYIRDLAPDSDRGARQGTRYLGDARTETATEASSDDEERRSISRRIRPEARSQSPRPSQSRPSPAPREREPEAADTDLLGLKDTPLPSAAEQSDALALALFSTSDARSSTSNGTTSATSNSNSSGWVAFSEQGSTDHNRTSTSGSSWELMLPQSSKDLAIVPSGGVMAGGFDNLLLDSLYEEAVTRQKYYGTAQVHGTYAASGILPQQSSTNPFIPKVSPAEVQMDPFNASATVPPPGWVQMDSMTKAHIAMTQEQQAWQQYQMSGYMAQTNPYAQATMRPSTALVMYNGA